LAAYPGEVFTGRVAAVLPEAQAESRTLRVRVELPNREGRLRPGMYATVRLSSGARRPVLLIPSEAIIRTGARSLVMVAAGVGGSHRVEGRTGREAGGSTEIISGLSEGENVVASGQFLIDSEASLSGVAPRSEGASAPTAPAGAQALHRTTGRIEALSSNTV